MKMEMVAPIAMKEPAPSLRLEGKYLKEFFPEGLDMKVGDKVNIEAEFRVKQVSSGEDYDGKKRDYVELEMVSSVNDADESGNKEDAKDEPKDNKKADYKNFSSKMRGMQGRSITVMN